MKIQGKPSEPSRWRSVHAVEFPGGHTQTQTQQRLASALCCWPMQFYKENATCIARPAQPASSMALYLSLSTNAAGFYLLGSALMRAHDPVCFSQASPSISLSSLPGRSIDRALRVHAAAVCGMCDASQKLSSALSLPAPAERMAASRVLAGWLAGSMDGSDGSTNERTANTPARSAPAPPRMLPCSPSCLANVGART